MILILLSCLSIFFALQGLRNSFKTKNLVMFIWVIVLYYALTSILVVFDPISSSISMEVKIKYMLNYSLCTLGFYLSDKIFNTTIYKEHELTFIIKEKLFIYIELVYWVSFIMTFLILRTQDYATYNTGNGGGWSQIFFMLSSGIIYLFAVKRQWVKIVMSFAMIVLIIAVLNVRSMLYFVLMPLGFFFLYQIMFQVKDLKHLISRLFPFVIIILFSAFILSYIRFGRFILPEAELTSIAFDSMENWSFGQQYINSLLQYISGFIAPIRNALNIVGISVPDIMSNIPSIPQYNAMMYAQVTDVSDLQNAFHMPSTLFYDFYVSWGNYAIIASFCVYWFILKVFSIYQKSLFRIIIFSSIIGWHFYMLMRGSVDTCASAMAYPLLLGIFFCVFAKLFNLIDSKSL